MTRLVAAGNRSGRRPVGHARVHQAEGPLTIVARDFRQNIYPPRVSARMERKRIKKIVTIIEKIIRPARRLGRTAFSRRVIRTKPVAVVVFTGYYCL